MPEEWKKRYAAEFFHRNVSTKVLCVCGNYSSILSQLERQLQYMEILRAFSVFQLMTILEEAPHDLIIIIEHDPLLYEHDPEMIEYISKSMSDAVKEAAVLLYSPGTDPFLEDLTRNADRVFCFDDGRRASMKPISI